MTSVASPQDLPVSASRLDRPTVHAGYWVTTAIVRETTWNSTTAQAITASGAPVKRVHGRCGAGRPEKCRYAATNRASAEKPSRMVVNPNPKAGKSFDHGTPKFETYHHPLTVANDSAVTNRIIAVTTVRLRLDFIAAAAMATAASAPMEPARPASTPKWCVHLVGVNISDRNEMTVMPIIRCAGPIAVPGIRPLRNVIAIDNARASSMASTAKRRATDPSGLVVKSREYRMCSSNQARLGPMVDLNELACISPTRVWSRKIRNRVTVPAAATGANSAQ